MPLKNSLVNLPCTSVQDHIYAIFLPLKLSIKPIIPNQVNDFTMES